MKKLLLRCLAVLLTGILVYTLLIATLLNLGWLYLLPNVKYTLGGYGYTLLRLQEAKKVKELDILFVGSSHVYRGFDTRIFQSYGMKTFNLGTSQQTPFNSYFLLKEYFLYFKPRYVVMDLYWNGLSANGVEAGVDIVSNSELSKNIIEMAWQTKNIVVWNSLLINRVHQQFASIDTSFQKYYQKDRYIKGGFIESARSGNAMSTQSLLQLPKQNFKSNPDQLKYLEQIILLCKENNVELLLTVVPVSEEYKNSLVNYETYANLIDKIATRHNLFLIDYNRKNELRLNTKVDFKDENHLNQTGVTKFNELFVLDFITYIGLN